MFCAVCNVRWSSLVLAFSIVTAFASVSGVAQTETVLHAFSGADGANPGIANLLIDSKGNLYGTTPSGGAHGYGTVYRIPAGGVRICCIALPENETEAIPSGGWWQATARFTV